MTPRKTSSGDVETAAENGTMASESRAAFNLLLQRMAIQAQLEDEQASDSKVETIAAIMNASDEDFWDADEKNSIGGRDLKDVEFELTGFRIVKSRGQGVANNVFKHPETGQGMYVEVTSVRLSESGVLPTKLVPAGEKFVWNTSAPAVVAKILSMDARGLIPHDCVMRAVDLGDGTATIKLKPLRSRSYVRGNLSGDEDA